MTPRCTAFPINRACETTHSGVAVPSRRDKLLGALIGRALQPQGGKALVLPAREDHGGVEQEHQRSRQPSYLPLNTLPRRAARARSGVRRVREPPLDVARELFEVVEMLGENGGDEVEVETPRGLKSYEILSFSTIHEAPDSD